MSDPIDIDDERARPRVPVWVAIVSVIVALVSASALVYLLYKETKGPGEILREFARRVDRHDCEGSYDLLDETLQGRLTEEAWCSQLPSIDAAIDADFRLEHAVLEGDTAEVEISGVQLTTWRLARFRERSWRVVGPPDMPLVAEAAP